MSTGTGVKTTSRVLYIEEITARTAKKVIRKLNAWNEESKKPITLYIDSNGGEVIAALDIYDVVRNSLAPITGIVQRRGASMALVILQACKKRYMMKNSHALVHSITVTRSLDDLLDDERCKKSLADSVERQKQIEKILVSRSKLKPAVVKAMMQRGAKGTRFTAAEAKTLGFVDRVL